MSFLTNIQLDGANNNNSAQAHEQHKRTKLKKELYMKEP